MANDTPTGTTSRPESTVLLREVRDDDLPLFFEHQLDPEANRMAAFPPRDREAFMAHWTTKILADDSVIKKTVLLDEQVAGNIVSFDHSGKPAVGYWIGRQYWGQGVATRALSAFLDHVEARPLYAHVAKHNIASIRVLEKCGFTIWGETSDFSTTSEVIEEFIFELQ